MIERKNDGMMQMLHWFDRSSCSAYARHLPLCRTYTKILCSLVQQIQLNIFLLFAEPHQKFSALQYIHFRIQQIHRKIQHNTLQCIWSTSSFNQLCPLQIWNSIHQSKYGILCNSMVVYAWQCRMHILTNRVPLLVHIDIIVEHFPDTVCSLCGMILYGNLFSAM